MADNLVERPIIGNASLERIATLKARLKSIKQWRERMVSKNDEQVVELSLNVFTDQFSPKIRIQVFYVKQMLDAYHTMITDELELFGVKLDMEQL